MQNNKRSVLVGTTLFIVALSIVSPADASKACGAPAQVSEVYPSTNVLPENLLRFYIYFSQPMARNDAAVEAIHIEDAAGDIVPGAFLPTRFALWSPDGKRLTLVLDPGRVKTGLAAHDAFGRALRRGMRYALVVPVALRDTRGCALTKPHRKAFTVIQADLSPPRPESWQIAVPRAGTRDPLTITLDGTYDHLSLAYRLRVRNSTGNVVAGSIRLADSDTTWIFKPRKTWAEADYTIAIGAQLEDLAGNRAGALFDRPAGRGAQPQQSGTLVLPFRASAMR
ncbi:MAG: hypothetical protein AAF732_13975 [Pseudomonadota bacterium]